MMKKITFMLTILFSLVLTNAFAQGSCATAVPLTPGTQQCGDTSSGADVYDNNTCLGSYDGGDDYIFSYVASATGETLTLDLTGVAGWTGFAMSDDCPDATTYNCLGSATTTSAGNINFTSTPLTAGVTYYIHISTWPSPQNTAFCLDAVVNPAPTCLNPDTFVESNVTTNTVDLSWNDPSGVQFNFEYVIQDSGLGTPTGSGVAIGATSANVISTDINSNPLTPNTAYEAWVRADCGGGDFSEWVGPVNFTTLCTAYAAPWTYDVETATATTNSSIADCWSSNPTGTTSAFRWNVDDNGGTPSTTSTGPSGANSGVKYFYTEASSGTTGAVAELYTPLVDLSALADPSLQFYYHMRGVNMGELHIDVFDGTTWTDDVLVITGEQQTAATDPWNLSVVSLSAYSGNTVQVRFRGVRGAGFEGDIALDDISFAEAPACFDPISLAASNITSSSIDLLFTDASGGSQFDFYYVVQPAGTGAPATYPAGVYEDGSNSIDGINYSIPVSSLASNTAYEIYVAADCNGNWVGPANFTTLCAPFSVPALEDFTTFLPSCWEEADGGDLTSGPSSFGTGGWVVDGFGNVGTTGAIKNNIYTTGANDWVLSPLYDIPVTGYELKFDAAATDFGQTVLTDTWESDDFVEVLVSTGTTNWTVLYTYNDANVPAPTGTVNIIDLDAYAGQQVRFAFRAVEGAANGAADIDFSVDNFEIRLTPSCPEPTMFNYSNITSTQVDLAWTSTGSAWNIEYGPTGFVQGTGTVVPAGTNPFTLGSLTSQTTYDVYVQNDCGGGDLSIWTGPITFTTSCSAVLAPWLYDVEAAATTTNSSIADCWSSSPTSTTTAFRWDIDGAGSTPSTNTGPTAAYSGVKYFYTEASSGGTGAVAELYTPFVDLSALTTPTLQFYYHMFGSTMGELHVDVFDGSVWVNDVDQIIGQQQTAMADPWVLRVVDLSAYVGGTIQVRFRGIRGTDFYGDMSLDDIAFAEAPSCYDPINVATTNVTSTTFDLEWVDASGGTQFDFYYVVQPAGTGTGGTLVENSYDLSSGVPFTVTCTDNTDCANTLLLPSTDYEVYVRADCSSNWVGPINFTTACAVYSVPALEDFTTYVPACWEEADNGDLTAGPATFGTSGWIADGFGSSNGTTTTGSVRYNIWQAAANDWLLSPLYDIPVTGYELKFDASVTDYNSPTLTDVWESDDYVEILVSTGTTNWTVLYTYNDGNVPAPTGTVNIIDLDAYAGQQVRFAFRVVEGAANGASDIDFMIDNFEIRLTPSCVQPVVASSTVTPNCGSFEFSVDVDVTDLGDTTAAFITDGVTNWPVTATGVISVGPFTSGSNVTLTLEHGTDSACDLPLGSFTYTCPPVNDDLCNAIPLTIGAPTTGSDYTLAGATAQTNEPVATCFNGGINGSVWFSFVAPSTDVEVTTDFAGGTLTDDDTEIAVYDATGVTCSDLSTLPAEIDCNQDGTAPVNTTYSSYLALSGLTPGTTYYVQVDMWGSATAGSFGIQVNDLLSTDDFSANEFVAYPNPVKDVLTLEYSSDITSIRVINMLGQEVLAKTMNATSTQVDMSQLAAGTYLVNVTSGDIQKIIKVVKH